MDLHKKSDALLENDLKHNAFRRSQHSNRLAPSKHNKNANYLLFGPMESPDVKKESEPDKSWLTVIGDKKGKEAKKDTHTLQ
uniref:Uncharacterized protein n=1 Tax=Romanomermis culicivorax TaxID=13658 RepID=A0A915J2G3_ROMCU